MAREALEIVLDAIFADDREASTRDNILNNLIQKNFNYKIFKFLLTIINEYFIMKTK